MSLLGIGSLKPKASKVSLSSNESETYKSYFQNVQKALAQIASSNKSYGNCRNCGANYQGNSKCLYCGSVNSFETTDK